MTSQAPVRVQRKRTKGWKMPENTVSVTRPGPWGNPFVVGEYPPLTFAHYHQGKVRDAEQAVALFRRALKDRLVFAVDDTVDALLPLRGKNLACFCQLDRPCHADVLLQLANVAEQSNKD